MKTNLSIALAAVVLLGMQACGSKTEKETTTEATVVAAPAEKVALTPAERKAKLAKEKAELAEKRRLRLEQQAAKAAFYTDSEGNIIYYKAEASPSYIGGNDAMVDFLKANLKYPEAAREAGIEGTVFVDFVVTKYGNVRGVEVTEETSANVDQAFRDEAVRVVSAMPKWKAGNQNGKTVDVMYSIPITFEIF